MKKQIMSIIMILCCAIVSGQILAPMIIAAVSDYFVHHGHELNWNPGEAIAETFITEQIQTRTGYNQPVTDIISHMNNEAQAGLYQPYVFSGQEKSCFIVKIKSEEGWEMTRLMLYNLFGIEVDEFVHKDNVNAKTNTVDVYQFSPNMFLMITTNNENQIIKRSTIILADM